MVVNYPKIYYYSSLLFAFTLPLSRASVSFFIILFPLIWLIEGDYKNKFSQVWQNPILKAIVFFLGFTFLSILWTQSLDDGLTIIRLYSYWLGIFVIAISLKKEYFDKIVTAFLYGMLASEIIAYGVFFEIWDFKGATVENPSPFMFWIDYSVFMAFTSILLLSRLFSNKFRLSEKVFIFLFFLSTTGNLFLGLGRTGQAALVVAIIVMVFLYMKPSIKSFFTGIILISLIYTAGYTLSETFQMRVKSAISDITKMSNNKFDSSWGIRVVYWMVTYDILKDNILFGVGIGDYEKTMKEYLDKNDYPINSVTKEFMKEHHAHNQFLMVLIQTGLIGLILMINLIYQMLKVKIDNNEIKILLILFLTVYFVSSMAEPLWFKQFTIALFVLFIGLFANNITQKEKINV